MNKYLDLRNTNHILLKFCLFLAFLNPCSKCLMAQNKNIIAGEYILQFDKQTDVTKILGENQIALKGEHVPYKHQQLMQEPMNLWLVKFVDVSVIPEIFFNQWVSEKIIKSIQPNRWLKERTIPNDPEFPKQWQYINDGSEGGLAGADLDIEKAWDITTGGTTTDGDTIVICIIDSGINGNHEDFQDNLWVNKYEIPGNGIDDDMNGYIDDYLGWNIEFDNDIVYNNSNHGSAVAGIVGAKGNNGVGVTGINWNIKMMIVDYERPTEANAIASYAYPYIMRKKYNESNGTQGAFVVATNASWGLDKTKAEEAPLWCGLFDLLGEVGILNCGATINENINVDDAGDLPTTCESEYLVSVTNMNRADNKVNAAGYGKRSIDLGAYGQSTYTTNSSGYGAFGGTSAATPHVAGTIGLMYATDCNILSGIAKTNPANAALIVKDMLLLGISENNSLNEITTSGGRLNTFNAVANVNSLCTNKSLPSGITFSSKGNNINVNWVTNQGLCKVKIRYRKNGTNEWTVKTDITSGFLIDSLEYCTEYEMQLGSDCASLTGAFGYSKYVTTTRCCNKPENVTAEYLNNTISIEWEEPEYYNQFQIEYKNFNGEWISENTDMTFFSINNIPECNLYIFRLKTICTDFDAVSIFSAPLSFSSDCGFCTETEYCTITGVLSNQEWIESVSIGQQEIRTGRDLTGYGYYPGTELFIMKAGTSDSIRITPGYSGSPFNEFYKMYIDFDQNGIWDDNELVFSNSESTRLPVSGFIHVPSTALPGITRMRVIMSYENFSGGCSDPKFEFGEAEDYCIKITKEPCAAPVSIDKIAITYDTIKLKLNTSEGIFDSLIFQYKKPSDSQVSSVTFSTKDFYLTGLDSCAVYLYDVSTYCDGTAQSIVLSDSLKTACRTSTNNDNKDTKIFKIFPNPFTDRIHIQFYNKPVSVKEINLTNAHYQVLYTYRNPLNIDDKGINLEMPSTLPTGLYILKIKVDDQIYFHKLIRY